MIDRGHHQVVKGSRFFLADQEGDYRKSGYENESQEEKHEWIRFFVQVNHLYHVLYHTRLGEFYCNSKGTHSNPVLSNEIMIYGG